MTQTSTPTVGQTITLIETAPVSAQFIGRTGTVERALGNAILIDIQGNGPAFVHLRWGTKRNPGQLKWELA